jgi:hypothetical protein
LAENEIGLESSKGSKTVLELNHVETRATVDAKPPLLEDDAFAFVIADCATTK